MLVAVSGAGLIVSQANASPITITNPGFEDVLLTSDNSPVTLTQITAAGLPDLYYYNGKVVGANPITEVPPAYVPGWSAVSDTIFSFRAGVQYQPFSQFSAGFPIGNNEVFANGIVVGQTLSDTLAANTQYTLSVLVARRNDGTPYAGYTVSLLAGSTVIGFDTAGVGLGSGAHLTSIVSVNSNLVSPGLLGQALRIELTGPTGNQAHFDNVQLDATLVPEPATLSLLGLAAGGLLTRRRRD